MNQTAVKSRKIKLFSYFSRCLTSTRSIGKVNFMKKFMVAKLLKKGLNIDIKLQGRNNTQWALHLSQVLQDIKFQTNTKDFQSHGNKCAVDIPQP